MRSLSYLRGAGLAAMVVLVPVVRCRSPRRPPRRLQTPLGVSAVAAIGSRGSASSLFLAAVRAFFDTRTSKSSHLNALFRCAAHFAAPRPLACSRSVARKAATSYMQ